jgi:uncharacterized membrane protein
MIPRITWCVCTFAAAITLILCCTSRVGLAPGDVIVVAFVLGPYLLLGLLAWRQRGKAIASRVLLAVAVVLAAWGLYLFSLDSYRYHTVAEYRMVQRMTVLLVPLLQWAAVLLVGLGLLGNWAIRRWNGSASRA